MIFIFFLFLKVHLESLLTPAFSGIIYKTSLNRGRGLPKGLQCPQRGPVIYQTSTLLDIYIELVFALCSPVSSDPIFLCYFTETIKMICFCYLSLTSKLDDGKLPLFFFSLFHLFVSIIYEKPER